MPMEEAMTKTISEVSKKTEIANSMLAIFPDPNGYTHYFLLYFIAHFCALLELSGNSFEISKFPVEEHTSNPSNINIS